MATLSAKKILEEQNTTDPDSIKSLTLTHRALSDVSCLAEFKNLERLDLEFNNLTSLEGLKSCTNLKWLSVVENKLQSLEGVDGLSKLTVLNAGRNKLKSLEEVKSLSGLRALILNDNEISSVCKLDQLKNLNTLVLSRNPISSLGESLVKLKSITKLSLSNCQLQKVDSSLRKCLKLKELRLAHNKIKTIPKEFGHLVQLENLDLGNNLISKWSNLEVLSSLRRLRNLNLQGNRIAEKDKEKLRKEVQKMLRELLIFNAKPIDEIPSKEVREAYAAGLSVEAMSSGDLSSRNKRTHDGKGIDSESPEESKDEDKKERNQPPNAKSDADGKGKESDRKSRILSKEDRVNILDSAEFPFTDLFASEDRENKLDCKMDPSIDAAGAVVTYPNKKSKKKRVDPTMLDLSHGDAIGLGGASAWGEC